jgi:predicted HicB family RNase H-like nuclease
MKKHSPFVKYLYRVAWSEEDQEYVGLCAELPSLSWLAGTQAAALQGIVELARRTIEDLVKGREPVPEPLATRHYSGQFKVRIPPQVHRQLAMEAAESKVSLNRLVSAKLAHG